MISEPCVVVKIAFQSFPRRVFLFSIWRLLFLFGVVPDAWQGGAGSVTSCDGNARMLALHAQGWMLSAYLLQL